jgi:threonine/homoserine efflux transporter RhtA
VAATIEPVVGALLALFLFHQNLTVLGWLGLVLVVSGVAAGYVLEGLKKQLDAEPEHPGRSV